jgi:hypothetical protein
VALIELLFERWPAFSDFIPFDFLLSLIAVPALPALNKALDFFRSITVRPLDQGIALAILDSLFTAMPRTFFRRQVGVALAIAANFLRTGTLESLSVVDLFLRHFPALSGFARGMLAPSFPDFTVEAADQLWAILSSVRE